MSADPMAFAYADPPYLGCCKLYDHFHGDDGLCWDDLTTHKLLIERLTSDYPDGWALSLGANNLQDILPLCPSDVRVCSWVKPFAAYKRNVRVAYTWEPVIVRGGRVSSKDGAGVNRDHLSEPITLRKGFTGAKPERFCRWVLDLLGWKPGDQMDDLFPGTGVMGRVVEISESDPTTLRYLRSDSDKRLSEVVQFLDYREEFGDDMMIDEVRRVISGGWSA